MSLSVIALLFASILTAGTAEIPSDEPYWKWTLEKAVQVLNSSAWARQETFTRVVGGVGSGVSGEKEIYNTFYVRFLSARPIREAFVRIQQIQHNYDGFTAEEKKRFDGLTRPNLEMDTSEWVVVTVAFRSNDPNEESGVRRYFQAQTKETLKTRAFLSTQRFSQVEIAAYFPPREEGVGAKFVFPREINGVPLIAGNGDRITFELTDVPGANPRLRSTFSIRPMVVDGKVIL